MESSQSACGVQIESSVITYSDDGLLDIALQAASCQDLDEKFLHIEKECVDALLNSVLTLKVATILHILKGCLPLLAQVLASEVKNGSS